MIGRRENPKLRNRNRRWFGLFAALSSGMIALAAGDFSSLCADRAAIERIYYNHRLGEKPPFEKALPPASVETLVRQELDKEAVLKKAYGAEVTPAMLQSEVQRINSTTRAPEMLAEIKAALGNDPGRFADTLAKPTLVERLLREKFDNDDTLHASERHDMERIRTSLTNAAAVFRNGRANAVASGSRGLEPEPPKLLTLATNTEVVEKLVAILKQSQVGSFTETTWQLGAHADERKEGVNAEQMAMKKRFGPNAQLLSTLPREAKDRKLYFEDLPSQLQQVLRVQLHQAGAVSAVIETPDRFLLYVATEKTETQLSVATLSLPKRSYENWWHQQSQSKP